MTALMPLSRHFASELAKLLTPQQQRLVVEANRAKTNPGICHTHDYLDANEVMWWCFCTIHDREPDVSSDADTRLINAAWDEAKANGFWWGLTQPRKGK